MRELYPDHDAYLARFEAAVRHRLGQGFLLWRDAERFRVAVAQREPV